MNIEITKRGNVRIDGEKFYAVPSGAGSDDPCALRCVGNHRASCHRLPCTATERYHDGYRLRTTSVAFVTREEFLKHKENINAR